MKSTREKMTAPPAGGAVISAQKRVVGHMIRYYCDNHHRGRERSEGLCDECRELLRYAYTRLDKCPYGDSKPNCSSCRIHCYKRDMKEAIKAVMRYSGPRMIFYAPGDMFVYLARKISYALKKK
ncbi:MAG: nitrous oxide-stimulated promoter family protein [Flavobacteriales bacterium]|jgi:hypothetical protein|nr:nitrous oxide-stimulated promoter family protein [Flavobacteriales bacterium]MBR4402054.1 nitrous oxide-stimulated promoter family protein [Flavobacteriales bacterium]